MLRTIYRKGNCAMDRWCLRLLFANHAGASFNIGMLLLRYSPSKRSGILRT